MTLDSFSLLSADRPLTDPGEDQLGYAPFARHLAESICTMSPSDGFVVGIYGPWGSGKSTLLEFVRYYLNQKPSSKQPAVVTFNPWWFSGHEDLTIRFFDQMQATLSKWKSFQKHLTKNIATFAQIVSATPIPYAGAGKAVAKALDSGLPNVAETKESIRTQLRASKKRILVIIDDIDRLSAEEIRQLFRVIKAVADFPNVTYLVAFDKAVVVKAVEQMQGISGEAYLEKIVQVPFDLPLPDKISLRRLLFKHLDAVVAGTPDELFDQTYWGNVYWDGIDPFIETPRDIVRLVNSLRVTYSSPLVKNEVNPVDFIAIEALRIFCPLLYDIIRKNGELFSGSSSRARSGGLSPEDLKRFHQSWVEQVPEKHRESVKKMVIRLFPRLEAVWGNTHYDYEWESTWRRQLRICSPDVFPRYFSLVVPESSICYSEMKSILALVSDAKALGARLVELAGEKRPDGTTKVRAILERLEDYTRTEIEPANIPAIIQVFFSVGDQLLRPEDKRSGMLEFGNDTRIGRLVWQLTSRLDDEQARYEMLRQAITNGSAVATIVDEVATFGQQHGKYGVQRGEPEAQWLVNAEHLDELEKIALQKIRSAAQNGSLLQSPDLPGIVYRWRDWGNEDEVKQWVENVNSTDQGLARFLETFVQQTFSQTLGDRVGKTTNRLDPKWLQPFLDPAQIIDRVKLLAANPELTEAQRTAANQLVREYEMREKGKDPDALDG